MSKVQINKYYTDLERAKQFSKSVNEDTLKSYFWMLLNEYSHKKNYEVARETYCQGTKGHNVKPDGIIKTAFYLDIGLWEAKDEKDKIEDEIDAKKRKGYPFYNILFTDDKVAVLFQRNEEVKRVNMLDADALDSILEMFISYKSDFVYKFEVAIENFKKDVPNIVKALREKIDETGPLKPDFIKARDVYFALCKAEINPDITLDDIREMMIQHILTSDLFNKVFDDPDFHRHNTIAHELEKLIDLLFTYTERKNLLGSIEHYYDAINVAASGVADHHEKQKFLKVLYETFYKVYNPKMADRLGVVYTPNEIVEFMIHSTDYLLEKHFGKTLSDKNVEILDPATGTGTFITSIIDHIPAKDLAYKYKNEIHANEVAILPYYIANLNIEYTFKQKMGYYEEFQNLCFVDTLDNIDALHYIGQQKSLSFVTSQNTERINRQNSKKISVIIGNPPYNANQKNENENNKNREYPAIDKRIKETYIKQSAAQKTKVYDMYARFLRWASDRINTNGIISFVSNNSFINSRTYDGFRKIVNEEFNEIYIIDLKGDARTSGESRKKESGNVFDDKIRVGIAVYFLVKKEGVNGCRIFYNSIEDYAKSDRKKEYLSNNILHKLNFEHIVPDKNHNWISLSEDNDWESLLPLATKEVKAGASKEALFKLFSLGAVSNRDDWVYDHNKITLHDKVNYFCNTYEKEKIRWNLSDKKIRINDFVDRKIKWTEELESYLIKSSDLKFDEYKIRLINYRPFYKLFGYIDRIIIHRPYQTQFIWGIEDLYDNLVITMTIHPQVDFAFFVSNVLVDQGFGSRATTILPLYSYDQNGRKYENITDWGLEQFRNHYDSEINKDNIFHYIYAVMYNPGYLKKYELNLKREYPRIPFYDDFWQWATWGKELMDLHINYETVEPYGLERIDKPIDEKKGTQINMFVVQEPESLLAYKAKIRVYLKADKEKGTIILDDITTLKGIPAEAWNYKLGNRSALEWILDQYKEKKPTDPTIAEKFNTYRFADYKEHIIDLLQRVCRVSVRTVEIVGEIGEINNFE